MRSMLTGLQIFTAVLGIGGTIWALLLLAAGGMVMLDAYGTQWDTFGVALLCLAAVMVVSFCCYRTLHCFYRMCQRLKTTHSFTEDNCLALKQMSKQCALAGAALLIAVTALMLWSLNGLLWMGAALFAIPFAFLTIALMLWAVHLLMRRALTIQEENDLTV